MSLPIIIYLIGIFETLIGVFIGICGVLVVVIPFSLCIYSDAGLDEKETRSIALRVCLGAIKALVCSVFILIILPSEDTSYKILAAYGVEAIATSQTAQNLAPKSLELLELTIDKHLIEMKGE